MDLFAWFTRLGSSGPEGKSICEDMECCQGQRIDVDTVHFLQSKGVDQAVVERVIRSKLVEFLAVYGSPEGVAALKVRKPGGGSTPSASIYGPAPPASSAASAASVCERVLQLELGADRRSMLVVKGSSKGVKRFALDQIAAVHSGLDPREYSGLTLPSNVEDVRCAHLRFRPNSGVKRTALRLVFSSMQQRNDFVFGLRALQLHPRLGGGDTAMGEASSASGPTWVQQAPSWS